MVLPHITARFSGLTTQSSFEVATSEDRTTKQDTTSPIAVPRTESLQRPAILMGVKALARLGGTLRHCNGHDLGKGPEEGKALGVFLRHIAKPRQGQEQLSGMSW